jgi:VWFA-related protein
MVVTIKTTTMKQQIKILNMRSFAIIWVVIFACSISIYAQQKESTSKTSSKISQPVIDQTETNPVENYSFKNSIELSSNELLKNDTTKSNSNSAVKEALMPFLIYAGLTDPVNTVITTHDELYFQELYATVAITDSDGNNITGLTSSNFTITENNANIDQFSVITASSTEPIGVSLVIDKSGSMQTDDRLKIAKKAALVFVEEMGSEDRAAVVAFDHVVEIELSMTSDKGVLKDSINSIQLGGYTALYDGIIAGLGELDCESSIKAVIALSDGEDNSSSGNINDIIEISLNNSSPVYTIGIGDTGSLSDSLQKIAYETNGKYYSVTNPETLIEVYLDIKNSIEGQYILGFSTLQPNLNGTSRNIEITATYNGFSSDDYYSYTAPLQGSSEPISITITDHTNEIIGSNQNPNAVVTITTLISPSSNSTIPDGGALLFYRTMAQSGTSYSEVSMSLNSQGEYEGTIPADSVISPGVQFFIKACDNVPLTVTSPSFPYIQPYDFAVLPNKAPLIEHTPILTAQVNTSVLINAKVTDNTDNVSEVKLFYRVHNAGNYLSVNMPHIGGSYYEASIPASYVTLDDVDYYIYAVDNYGIHSTHGNMDIPHIINVSELELIIISPFTKRCPNDISIFNTTIVGLPPGVNVIYEWDFGDGSPIFIYPPPVEHSFSNTSSQIILYTVTCTATLSTEEVLTDTFPIYVYPTPQINVNPKCIREGQTVHFSSQSEVPVESWGLYYDAGNGNVQIAEGMGNEVDVNFVFPSDIMGEIEITLVYEYFYDLLYCSGHTTVGVKSDNCIFPFAPRPGADYVISAWVSEDMFSPPQTTFTTPVIILGFLLENESFVELSPLRASGSIIDGWQKIEETFTIPQEAVDITVNLINSNWEIDAYFDDIRIFPVHSNMKSYVYDPVTLKFTAELDENNFATYYEYDQEGKLTRVKKETEKGIVTLQESRSHTSKLSSDK